MVSLSLLTPIQSNDSVTLRLTDSTGAYNAQTNTTGWGSPNTSYTDIISGSTTGSSKYWLKLTVAVMTSSGSETVYDQIDLFDNCGPFSSLSTLVFDITPSLLIQYNTELYASSRVLLDGWYTITYSLIEAFGTNDVISSITIEFVLDGNVRTKVYEALRTVPYSTTFEKYTHNIDEWDNIINPIYFYSLLVGMLSEVTTAKKREILDILSTLERNLTL